MDWFVVAQGHLQHKTLPKQFVYFWPVPQVFRVFVYKQNSMSQPTCFSSLMPNCGLQLKKKKTRRGGTYSGYIVPTILFNCLLDRHVGIISLSSRYKDSFIFLVQPLLQMRVQIPNYTARNSRESKLRIRLKAEISPIKEILSVRLIHFPVSVSYTHLTLPTNAEV